jgi:hypothetical protein
MAMGTFYRDRLAFLAGVLVGWQWTAEHTEPSAQEARPSR